MTQEQQERVLNNDALVFTCYRRELHHGWVTRFWQEDLLQEGRYGLCKAAVTFDEKSGRAFTTYAYACIRNEMINALRRFRGDIDKHYLDDVVGSTDGRNPLRIADTLIAPEMQIKTEEKGFLDTICEICTEDEKRVVKLILDGYTGKDLYAKLENLNTRQAVSRWYRKFINRCKVMWQLSKTFEEFPKESDYVDRAFYLNDLRRLWCMSDKNNFKRSQNLLKINRELYSVR